MPDWSRFTFGITIRTPDTRVSSGQPEPELGEPARHDRVPIYARALELATQIHAVVEATDAERYFVRDQLDRKSAVVPQLIAQGLATAEMTARRALYVRAREALTDCATLLDMLSHRATVALDDLEPARALALALLDELLPLTVPPLRTR
ncbi:MAG: four helix bundle protein [Myxococcales bacterium]|nr:four helix bundle protein [Myxococcales bacterium]